MVADRYIINVEGAIGKDGRYLMVVRSEEEFSPSGQVEGAEGASDALKETLPACRNLRKAV